ncbi:MAG TPA: hypothetical protein VEZ11_00305, partial [Thermoanaerobaculia bacterium]|nr:hypothetical protein [Thermoanaerobaculia bacterium]
MHRRRAGFLLGAALLLSAWPSLGYRREYRVTSDGVRKAGSEVCFYRGDSAADAFSLFFTHDEVVCLPADSVLDMPPGLFHAFARHADGYVSAHRDFFVYRGAPIPESGYESLEIPLQPAAFVDIKLTLAPGQSIGVWLAPTPTTGGTFIPLVTGEHTIMVPADTAFVPLLIEYHRPVAVGEATTLSPGERRSLAGFNSPAGTVDVVVWTKLDSLVARDVKGTLPPPEITITQQRQTYQPLFRLEDARRATHTLLFFKEVRSGPARLRVRGKWWVAS